MSNELAVYDKFRPELEAFKLADAEKVFDYTTPDGYAEGKRYYAKLRKVRNRVDDLRLDTTKIYRDKVSNINTEGNGIIAEIDAMADPRKALMDAEDAKVQAIIDKQAKEAEDAAAYDLDWRLAHLENGERKLKAAEDKQKAEAEAVEELAQQARDTIKHQKEADIRIAAAVEKVKKDAEKETKRVADAQFEKERKEHAEKNRIAAEKLHRQLDEDHRLEIESDIHHDMTMIITPVESFDGVVPAIIDAIKYGKIPNLEIKY